MIDWNQIEAEVVANAQARAATEFERFGYGREVRRAVETIRFKIEHTPQVEENWHDLYIECETMRAKERAEHEREMAAKDSIIERLEKLKVHCERCGGDYAQTGVEVGCSCEKDEKIAELKAKIVELEQPHKESDERTMHLNKQLLKVSIMILDLVEEVNDV